MEVMLYDRRKATKSSRDAIFSTAKVLSLRAFRHMHAYV